MLFNPLVAIAGIYPGGPPSNSSIPRSIAVEGNDDHPDAVGGLGESELAPDGAVRADRGRRRRPARLAAPEPLEELPGGLPLRELE
jgi:hypothetical protein